MNMKKNLFVENIAEHLMLVNSLSSLNGEVCHAGEMAGQCLKSGGKIMFCGNGGSAADSSALTCIGNDYSFDDVFARQVAGLGRAGDLLIGISTSGNSRNVIRAVEEAQKLGMQTIGLLGREGGQLRSLCDHSIVVPSTVTARIQECHILIGHTLCGLIEQEMGLA
jgi:D-sedoheptulose 7-phosphate isomerase